MSNNQNSLIADDDELGGNDTYAESGLFDGERDTKPHAVSRDTNAARRQPRSKVQAQTAQAVEFDDEQDDEPQDDPMQYIQSRDLPPLPGNVQMLVRISIQGQPDYDNVRSFYDKGWRPRTRASVPEGFSIGSRKVSFDELDFGDVVCNRDRILMERPKVLHEREKALDKSLQTSIGSQIRGMIQGNQQYGITSTILDNQVGLMSDGVFSL